MQKSIKWCGHSLTIRASEVARQADGSVWLQFGKTVVLATAVVEKKAQTDINFLPLTVNYFEKAYAANKIPGSYNRREGKPQDHEACIARMIDRSLRPLLPDGICNEIQVIVTVLSYDPALGTETASMIAAFLALQQTGLPLKTSTPVVGILMGYSDQQFLPFVHNTELELFISLTQGKIIMMEASGKEIPHHLITEGCRLALTHAEPLLNFIETFFPKTKEFSPQMQTIDTKPMIPYHDRIKEALSIPLKQHRHIALADIQRELQVNDLSFEAYQKQVLLDMTLTEKRRIDGRSLHENRPLSVEIQPLSQVHSSVLLTRGETQILSIITIGSPEDRQYIDDLNLKHSEHLISHYFFPPFCVGETGHIGAPSRREIGHSHLIWRAINCLIPREPDYTYRIINEVLSSNGSSSMTSICATSLALIRGGIPLKNHVAGVAIGYIGDEKAGEFFTDIIGDEDMLGLLDLKVAGTRNGLTAIQMDMKTIGFTIEMLQTALDHARKALDDILGAMYAAAKPRSFVLPDSVPKKTSMDIGRDRIKTLIGKGGKTINQISKECEVKIDVRDSGHIFLSSDTWKNIYKCKKIIRATVQEPEKGKLYEGTVTEIADNLIEMQIERYLKGTLKFGNHKEKFEAIQSLKVGSKAHVYYTGCDRYGNITLRLAKGE